MSILPVTVSSIHLFSVKNRSVVNRSVLSLYGEGFFLFTKLTSAGMLASHQNDK